MELHEVYAAIVAKLEPIAEADGMSDNCYVKIKRGEVLGLPVFNKGVDEGKRILALELLQLLKG